MSDSDIVERLRQPWAPSTLSHPLMTEAADTITRLTSENERLRAAVALWRTAYEAESLVGLSMAYDATALSPPAQEPGT